MRALLTTCARVSGTAIALAVCVPVLALIAVAVERCDEDRGLA